MSHILEAALKRIAAATPNNTNSASAESMASWTYAVATAALEEHAARELQIGANSGGLVRKVRAYRAIYPQASLTAALKAVREDGWSPQ